MVSEPALEAMTVECGGDPLLHLVSVTAASGLLRRAARQERQVKQRAAAITLLGRDIRRGYGDGAREEGCGRACV